jgi:WD40 repeat protein/serine/threonine protein kinase/Tfp pilus assembly protein PilF
MAEGESGWIPGGPADAVFAKFVRANQEGREADLDDLCARHPDLAPALRVLHSAHLHGQSLLESRSFHDLLREHLGHDAAPLLGAGRRYTVRGEIAAGGMGVVYRVFDEQLQRPLAMKVLRRGAVAGAREGPQGSSPQILSRFLSEARVTGRLDHPGVVPVHELGIDGEGRVFFTMRLVEGSDLREVFGLARRGEGGWSLPRAVGTLVKVCETLAYAHSLGVIHRDLKPSNVMVGRFGETYIVDWGLAKVMGQDDPRDLRIRRQGEGSSAGEEEAGDAPDSPLVTMDGTVLGTPVYMPPEQAMGRTEEIDERSDIYSVGAMLYALLSGRTPYVEPGDRPSSRQVLEAVAQGPPKPITCIDRRAPPELVAICQKAMARSIGERYQRMQDLAEDLQAFLDVRVVRAYRTDPWAEFRKWVARNRALAATISAALVMVLAGLAFFITWQEGAREEIASERDVKARALEEATRQLVKAHVVTGMKSMDGGDYLTALPHFAEALRLDRGDPEREIAHRLRIASTIARCPRLVEVWFHGGKVTHAGFSPDGRLAVTASEDRTARVWSIPAGEPQSPWLQHGGAVLHADLGPDGRLALTACADGEARVWEWASGSLLFSLRHEGAVARASFSPDGARIVTASRDGTGGLWSAGTGERIAVLKHEGPLSHAAMIRDGGLAVTCGADATARLWDGRTGAGLSVLKHEGPVHHAAFSPDGAFLATAGGGRGVRVWRADASGRLERTIDDPHEFHHVTFSPDGLHLFAVGERRKGRIWRWGTGEAVTPYIVHRYGVDRAEFSPDGRAVLTASRGGAVGIWSVRTGQPLHQSLFHATYVRSAAFGPEGNLVLTACDDGTARLWDLARGEPRLPPLEHEGSALNVRFSPDGQRLFTGGADGKVRIWNAATGEPWRAPLHHGGMLLWIDVSRDGSRIATSSQNGTVSIWEAISGERVAVLELDAAASRVAFSPDGRLLATMTHKGSVQLWDAATGRPTGFEAKHRSMGRGVAFSEDGCLLVTGSEDGAARIWVVSTGEAQGEEMRHPGVVQNVSFSPDGRRVLTASFDGSARLWAASDGRLLHVLTGHSIFLRDAAFSSDGRRIVTASYDGTACVWEENDGWRITVRLPHATAVERASFALDDRLVLTASAGGSGRVWDRMSGEPVTLPLSHGDDVTSIHFSPKTRQIATAGHDRTARVWDLPGDDRPLEDLVLLASLLAGRRIDEAGSTAAIASAEFRSAWETLRARYPGDFAARPEELRSWHLREAAGLENETDSSARIWHLDRLIEREPANGRLLCRRARMRAEAGAFQDAARDFERAIAEGEDDLDAWYSRAVALLGAGDRSGYQALCERLVERHREERDPTTANKVAWPCALAPGALRDYEDVLDLVREVIEEGRASHHNTLGALLLRAGQIEAAEAQLSLAMRKRRTGGSSWDWLFLALTHHAMGRHDDARRDLESASDLMSDLASGRTNGASPGSSWERELSLHILLEEVRARVTARAAEPLRRP